MVENISYSDITMKNVDPAITFTCYYPRIPTNDAPQAVRSGTPIFRNIHISNLTAICPRGAGIIVGLPESLVSDVVLENVHITAATGLMTQKCQRAFNFLKNTYRLRRNRGRHSHHGKCGSVRVAGRY